MGPITIETLKRVCPQLDRIDEPACLMAELIWIKYLAYNLIKNRSISTSNQHIRDTGVNAVVITKSEAERSYPTKLVLQCTEHPAFEGMILSENEEPELLRPFCLGVRYDEMPKPYNSLKKTIAKIGVSHVDGDNLRHVLDRLLLMNHLRKRIGDQFWNNLNIYTQYLKSEGIIKTVWLDN